MSKKIRESVLAGFAEGRDRSNAAAALDAAAAMLRDIASQSFWNAADELEGIVRDKAAPADPHAEVPA